MLLDGVMLLWFIQVLVAVVFVAVDIRHTPESPVMKWGFVIVTLYTGALGAFLYVLACRQPFPGTHAEYVRPRWRQVVGSTTGSSWPVRSDRSPHTDRCHSGRVQLSRSLVWPFSLGPQGAGSASVR